MRATTQEEQALLIELFLPFKPQPCDLDDVLEFKRGAWHAQQDTIGGRGLEPTRVSEAHGWCPHYAEGYRMGQKLAHGLLSDHRGLKRVPGHGRNTMRLLPLLG